MGALPQAGGPKLLEQDRLQSQLLILDILQDSSRRLDAINSKSSSRGIVEVVAKHQLLILKALQRAILSSGHTKPAVLPEAISQFERVGSIAC